MLLMVAIGYVFSYLIPMKQKTVKFPIYSNQALFIAQSGVEFAIRYAADQGWRGATDGVFDLTRLNGSRSLGVGTFTLNYDQPTNTLTSTGQITGSSENRVVRVSNFSPFLRLVFITNPPYSNPCRTPPAGSVPGGLTRNQAARFYIQNVRGTNVVLTMFSASWTGPRGGRLQRIYVNQGAGWIEKYRGNYASGTLPPVNFNRGGGSQTITPNQVITVLLYFNFNLAGDSNFIITFYTASGDGYTFNLDPRGNGLPTC
jgi:hypothetical protein